MQPLTRLQAFQSFGAASCLVSCCALAAPKSNGGFEAYDITGFSFQALGSTIQPPDSIAFRGLGVMASEIQPFLELTGNIGRGGDGRLDPMATLADNR